MCVAIFIFGVRSLFLGSGSGASFVWLIVTIDESRKSKADGIVFSYERDVSGNGRYIFQSLPLGYTPMLWCFT
jgi:hypothetical protein